MGLGLMMRMGFCCTFCLREATVGSERRGLRNPFLLIERNSFTTTAAGLNNGDKIGEKRRIGRKKRTQKVREDRGKKWGDKRKRD